MAARSSAIAPQNVTANSTPRAMRGWPVFTAARIFAS